MAIKTPYLYVDRTVVVQAGHAVLLILARDFSFNDGAACTWQGSAGSPDRCLAVQTVMSWLPQRPHPDLYPNVTTIQFITLQHVVRQIVTTRTLPSIPGSSTR